MNPPEHPPAPAPLPRDAAGDRPVTVHETELRGTYTVDLPDGPGDHDLLHLFTRPAPGARDPDSRSAPARVGAGARAGTLRGLHYQLPPATETKLVRCTRGAILDVIVDLRPQSPTYLRHTAVELSAANRRALFVPPLFAHGYQTLTDDAEVTYQLSEFYLPGAERGLRFDDPDLGIRWPLPVGAVSVRDAAWPLLAHRRDLPRPAALGSR